MSAVASTPYQPSAVSVVPDRREVAVIPAGDLDLSTVDQLADEMRELWDVGFDQIVLDLRRLEFLDCCGLRLLLSLRSDAERDGDRLQLVPGRPAVERLFELTATRDLFDWRDH